MKNLVQYNIESKKSNEQKYRYLSEDELIKLDKEKQDFLKDKPEQVHIEKIFEFGCKYYIEFENPFNDANKISSSVKECVSLNEESNVSCIGIADKFGRIWLHNVFNETAYIEYKEKTRFCKEGFYITRKQLPHYKVKTIYEKDKEPIHVIDKMLYEDVYSLKIKKVKSIHKI